MAHPQRLVQKLSRRVQQHKILWHTDNMVPINIVVSGDSSTFTFSLPRLDELEGPLSVKLVSICVEGNDASVNAEVRCDLGIPHVHNTRYGGPSACLGVGNLVYAEYIPWPTVFCARRGTSSSSTFTLIGLDESTLDLSVVAMLQISPVH